MTATNLPSRREALARAKSVGEIDVLIVGGGINGCGVFRDLALNGVDAMIVDRLDFGAGASMASSRMAHGGLRYLENGEFRLTAEATRERNLLLKNAPHMVRGLPIAIPFFSIFSGLLISVKRALGLKASLRERGFIMAEIGLLLYDWFGRFNRGLPLHHAMMQRRLKARFPALHPCVRALSIYHDAVITSPERVALELVSDALAAHPQSLALNHCGVEALEGGRVVLRDRIGGERFLLRPKLVVNAGGAWIDRINGAIGEGRALIAGAKGSHLVINQPALLKALAGHGMIFDDGHGRVCIVYPMGDRVLLGSTDIPVSDPDTATCTQEEEDYLLAAIRVIFPTVEVGREHVVYRFCGVRPLPKSEAATPGAVSRDHSLVMFEPKDGRSFPILSLVGGKWTTFRAFAAQVGDAVLKRLGGARRVDTATVAIGGGEGFAVREDEQQALAESIATKRGLDRIHARALVARYGGGCDEVAAFLAEGPDAPLPGARTYSEREIRRLARKEMAATPDDVIFRRTTLAMEGLLSRALLDRVNAIVAEETGQAPERSSETLTAVLRRLTTDNGVPNLQSQRTL